MTRHLLVCVTTYWYALRSVAIAISESPEIRQMLVDLQSGMDPDEVEAQMKKMEEDEAATHNRKTRRLEEVETTVPSLISRVICSIRNHICKFCMP